MGNSFETIKYNKHFITSVICRVDFSDDLPDDVITELSVGTEIKTHFPMLAKDQIENTTGFNVVQKGNEDPIISRVTDTIVKKTFTDISGSNKCIFSKKSLALEYAAYNSFEELQKHFMTIVEKIVALYPNAKISRFGLRYINTYNCDLIRIQKNFFAKEINSLIGIQAAGNSNLSRAMGHIEYIRDEIRLSVNFGEFNRSYPGILQKHDFVLDYDAVIQGVYKLSDLIPAKLINAHELIQLAFEQNITDVLRDEMNK